MGCKSSTKNRQIKNNKQNANEDQKNGTNTGDNGEKNSIVPSPFLENKKDHANQEEEEIEQIDTKDIPKNCVELRVPADSSEKLFPVWLSKDEKTKIYVRGKWCLLPDYGITNYLGHSESSLMSRKCLVGALIGRIQGGKDFEVKDGMTLYPDASGALYLFANNDGSSVNPKGSLHVYIQNAKQYSHEEIDKMAGWDIKKLTNGLNVDYLKNEEKEVILFINKIRDDPRRFAEKYLEHLKDKPSTAYREIYEKLSKFDPIPILRPCTALALAARDHARDMGEKGTTGHASTDGRDLKTRISKYAYNPLYFGENCCHKIKDPLSIVINMLVDDGLLSRDNRVRILNETYSQIGVAIERHYSYNWICVQVFGNKINDI